MDKFTIPEDNEATRAAFLMGLSFGGLVLMGASEQTMEDALLALFDTDAKGLDKALDALSKSLDTGSDIFAALREANS